ncbi:MAG: DUF4199 domain-containing protein [Bacteroidales bacterium]|jgi:hypothetical protein|nr:DUF4199 domain-containing protein [Bacteroidales bacterium]
MENTPATGNSKWSLAAKDGLILAAVTVVISTLTFLTKNTILSSLLWLIKLGGSIWLLSVIMKRYGKAHPEESTFSYGLIVCVLSALVCAVWAFVEYQFLFPNAVAEAFEQMYTQFEQMGSMFPDEFTDVLLKMEDNYAQINCISTFVWCTLLGLLFSAILARTTSGNRSVFTPEEMKQNQDDEFNF